MAAPVVTRPSASVSEDAESEKSVWTPEMTEYARWVVIGAIVIAVVLLATLGITTLAENSRVNALKGEWDLVFTALKDKKDAEEQRGALEGIAEKVKGTPAHAYVLQRLGGIYFDKAIDSTKTPEDRAKAIDTAVKIYSVLANDEPYKSSPLFGALGVDNLATAYEQQKNYDAAISLLEERLPKLENNSLYYKMSAQLGRLYWLKSLATNDESLRVKARERLADVLRATSEKEQGGVWRVQAEYIKSLCDPRGKALPEGTEPPAPEKAAGETPKTDAPKEAGAATPSDGKKDDAKPVEKPADKKDEKKEDKKDEKKTSSANETPANAGVSASTTTASASPSGHISFRQMMDMAKTGNTSFCGCARCNPPGKNLLPLPGATPLQ
jgi:tetratricopeptide (TPR) repeat protein